MVWIRTIDPDDAGGRLAEAYAWQAHKLGRPTEFTQLGSLAVPPGRSASGMCTRCRGRG